MTPLRAELQLNCRSFLEGIRQVNDSIDSTTKNVAAFVGGFAAIKAAGDMIMRQFEGVKRAIDLGGDLDDLSATTGQTVRDLVLLDKAFEMGGLQGGLEPMLKMLSKALTGVNEEGQPTKAVFDRLGLSLASLKGMTAIQQLQAMQVAFRQIEDPADRARAAMDLFGGKGAKMLTLLSDSDALVKAERQVGQLGDTMQENAGSFATMGDAIESVKTKSEQFFAAFTAGLAGTAANPLEAFSKLDFTGPGEAMGKFAGSVAKVVAAGMALKPVIIGVTGAMAVNSLSAKVASTALGTEFRAALVKLRTDLAATRLQLSFSGAGFTAFAATARTGMAAAATAVSTSVRAMLAALGPLGIGLMAVTYGIQKYQEYADGKNTNAKAAAEVVNDNVSHGKGDLAVIGSVATEEERQNGFKQLAEEADLVREKLSKVSEEYDHLDDEGQAAVILALQQWAARIENTRDVLARVPKELMAARLAERDHGKAIEETTKKLTEQREEAEKLRKERSTKFSEDVKKLDADSLTTAREKLAPAQQKQQILASVGMPSESALWNSMQRDRAKLFSVKVEDDFGRKYANSLTSSIEKYLEALRQIQEVKKKEAELDRERLKNQEEAHRKLAAFEVAQRRELELVRAVAEGRGGDVVRLQDLDKRDELIRRGVDAGQGVMPATAAANQQVGYERAAKLSEMRSDVDYDIARLMAEAAGDMATVRNMERDRKVEALTKRQIEAGEGPAIAREKAMRQADLEDRVQKGKTSAAVSEDRRLGLGGGFGGTSGDPVVRETQRQTREIQQQTAILKEMKQELQQGSKGPKMPGGSGPVFR